MKQNVLLGFLLFSTGFIFLSSCEEEVKRLTFPLSAEVFYSADGRRVAFTALTHSAETWYWEFGDGATSTEKNPVHAYPEGGYYIATLTAYDEMGNSVTKEVKLAIQLTPYALLTGDHTADDYDGKTWRLSSDHPSGGDYFANCDASLSVVDGTPQPLNAGIFELYFAMGDIYKDEYTFYYDGTYKHDVKEDGGAFSGLVFEYVTNGGAGIINDNAEDFGLCIAEYTPEPNAFFYFEEEEDLIVPSVYSPDGIKFNNVMTLDFSGTEFIGFRDFQRKVILKSISDTRMQLIMFMAASPGDLPKNTHALILSFEAVNP